MFLLIFQTRPVSSIMLLYIFGTLFGLMLSRILRREGSELGFEKEKADYKTGLFSMLGKCRLYSPGSANH